MASHGGAPLQFSSDVVTRGLEDGVLLVNLETGRTWKLNHVGAVVCRGIEQGDDLPSIVGEVAERYGIDTATARRDIDLLVADLHKEGLLEPKVGG